MNVGLTLTAVLIALALPTLAGGRLASSASPRQLMLFSLGCLSAIALGFPVVLGAIVNPGGLSAGTLSEVVGRCVDAAGRILDHPLRHWPRITASLLLVAVIGRLVYAVVVTLRDSRREIRSVLAGMDAVGDRQGVMVVPGARPVAFVAGAIRRRVVVSQAFIDELDQPYRAAVLAHEAAHVRGWHPALHLFGLSIGRAFPFVPPVRRAADLLLLSLEVSADEAAVRHVGDPLLVANAMLAMAEGSSQRQMVSPGATGGALAVRIDRLASGQRASRVPPQLGSAAFVGLVGALLVILALAIPPSARTLSGQSASRPVHSFCHLPHSFG